MVQYNIYWNGFAILVADGDCHFNVLVSHFSAGSPSKFTLHQCNVDVVSHVACNSNSNHL